MAQPRGRRRLVTLAVFVLAALTLLTVGGPLRSAAASATRVVIAPFVDIVRGVTQPVGRAVAGVFNYSNVVEQNQVLSHELGQLRLQQFEATFQRQQLSALLALQHLPFVGALPTVTAQANARNLSNFASTIEINKGTSSGILVGMPVVGNAGLVGMVTSTSSTGSTVRLINDASTSIGVTFGTPGYFAQLYGEGPGRDLQANFVAPGTPVTNGELFFTSGLQSGLYPAGLPVGRVVESASHRGASQLSISVQPLANLSSISYVDVILWEPGS